MPTKRELTEENERLAKELAVSEEARDGLFSKVRDLEWRRSEESRQRATELIANEDLRAEYAQQAMRLAELESLVVRMSATIFPEKGKRS